MNIDFPKIDTRILELVPDRLWSIASTILLDGRVSAYPSNVRGYSDGHCYLLKENNDAILIDSGFASYRDQIIGSLSQLISKDDELSIFPLRINEYMSVGNVEAISNTFRAKQCFSSIPNIHLWMKFSRHSETLAGYELNTALVKRAQDIHMGPEGARVLHAFQAPIRLIGTRWIYDHATRTLFTSDSFTHQWQSVSGEDPIITSASDVADAQHVRSFLLNTRYWWLEGGKTSELCRKLDAVRRDFPIERIAPSYGKITEGAAAVDRQFDVLISALEQLDRSNSVCTYVDRELIR